MTSKALVARITAAVLPGVAAPVGVGPVIPQRAEAKHYRFGRAAWPLMWICDLTGFRKEGEKHTVELTDPKSFGVMGAMVTTASLGLPKDEATLVLRRDSPVALIALPMDDPRTEETLTALHAIWQGGD